MLIRKRQDDFYKQYSIDELIAQVKLDLIKIDNYDQDQYEDWFSQVYPLDKLTNATLDNPYCIFLLNQDKSLKQKLIQWLNLITTE